MALQKRNEDSSEFVDWSRNTLTEFSRIKNAMEKFTSSNNLPMSGLFALSFATEIGFFREVIYRECGIKLTEMKKALMQARLMKRLRELNMKDYSEYRDYVIENYSSEIVNLINCITTNKTDFFRESNHFDFMHNVVLPEFEKLGKKSLRIWSAGCSTGEEPYTNAITLFEYFRDRRMPDIKILATDIDTQVIEKGRNGVYKADIIDVIEPEIAKRYFLKGKGDNEGFFRIKEFVRDIVYFRRLNLLDETFPMKRMFDIILCRNVIIYFDRESQKKLFANFYRHLHDDGYLCHYSETLTGITDKFNFVKNTI